MVNLEWFQAAAAILAILAGLYAFLKKVVPWIKMTINSFLGLDILQNLTADVAFIKAELVPNGGASLRDAVDALGLDTRETKQLQLAYLSSRNESMFRTDAEGLCTWVNRAYMRLTGRAFHELKGHGWVNILHPDNREEVAEAWYDSIKKRKAFEEVVDLQSANGEKISVQVQSFVMRDQDRDPTGYLGVVHIVA